MGISKQVFRPAYATLSKSKRFRDSIWKQANWIRCRQWIESHPCKSFAEGYEKPRTAYFEYLYKTCDLSGPIDYLEFGVYRGDSIRWWVQMNQDPGSRFIGFDSFEGLPEEWTSNHPKGFFTTQGKVPDIKDERCRFVAGFFNKSLPRFLKDFQFGNKLVVHLDADLYSSTLCVLSLLQPYLKPGDVLMFDEFSDACHECRAWIDFNSAFEMPYVAIANASNYWHLALQLT